MSDDWGSGEPSGGFENHLSNGDGGGSGSPRGGSSRGFGRSSRGFGKPRSSFGKSDEGGVDSGETNNGGNNDSEGQGGGGFRGGRGGGFGRRNQSDDGGEDGGGFGGSSRGGFGGRGGGGRGGGGFGRRNRDDGESGGGGFGRRNRDDGESGGGGFSRRNRDDGESRGGGGGFGRRNRDDGESGGGGGFGRRNRDDGESGGGGFGGGRGGGGRGGGGFGRRDRTDDGESGGGGGGGFGRRNREDGESGGGGFGRRNREDGESGGGGGGFGRRNRSEDGESGGGGFSRRDRSDGDEGGDGEQKPREIYIPPAPPESEAELFATMAAGLNFSKYDEIPVEVTGRDPPAHISSFAECGFFETTQKNIEKCNYTHPTPVQKYAIPIIMQGRDLMACAQTGSGKTAAFLLPSITRMIKDNVPGASAGDAQSPNILIISPTRELTFQIYGEARKFVHDSIYRPVVVYGGVSVGHQLRQVEQGCNILVGTPGRLLDFLNRKKILLDNLRVLILDEADRMLDMGFEPDIRRVVEEFAMPQKGERQTLMFSATFPEEIQHLAAEFLHDHIFLTVGVVGGTTSDIQQNVVEVGEYEKRDKLQEILSSSGADRVLVFVATKRNADFLASFLSQEEFPTTSIHGDRFQREREEALRDFRTGRSRVLVATSVAARGLDIPKVKHVINYDLPSQIEEYVHRIGRTGRIGNKGEATAFFQSDKDSGLARGLVKVLADAHQDVPDFLEQAAEAAVGSNYGPSGGRFASKDIRVRGGRDDGEGFGGDSSGFGNDRGGFGNSFGDSATGGFTNAAPAQDDDVAWD